MKPVISMSTLRGIPVKDSIALARECGFGGIEIQMDYLPETEEETDAIFQMARDAKLRVSLHAPCGDINISALNRGIREESIRQVMQTIDLAARYKVGPVTFHPGRLSSAREDREEKWQVLRRAVSLISRYALEKDVFVGLENMEARKKELVLSVDDLNRFADLENPRFGVTMDLSHFATNGITDPERPLLPIHNIHISQSREGKPHLPMQDGGSVLTGALKQWLQNYTGCIVLELKSIRDPEIYRKSLEWLKKELAL